MEDDDAELNAQLDELGAFLLANCKEAQSLRLLIDLVREKAAEASDAKARYREAVQLVGEMRHGEVDELVDLLEAENAELRREGDALRHNFEVTRDSRDASAAACAALDTDLQARTDALQASASAADALRRELATRKIVAARTSYCFADEDDDWLSPGVVDSERVHPEPIHVPCVRLPPRALALPTPSRVTVSRSIQVASASVSDIDLHMPTYDGADTRRFISY